MNRRKPIVCRNCVRPVGACHCFRLRYELGKAEYGQDGTIFYHDPENGKYYTVCENMNPLIAQSVMDVLEAAWDAQGRIHEMPHFKHVFLKHQKRKEA